MTCSTAIPVISCHTSEHCLKYNLLWHKQSNDAFLPAWPKQLHLTAVSYSVFGMAIEKNDVGYSLDHIQVFPDSSMETKNNSG